MIQLSLSQNDFADAALAHIGRMTNLEILLLVNSRRITDAGLIHLRKLPRLTELTLDGLGITDAGLIYLAGVNQPAYVLVKYTAVTANGLDGLKNSRPTCNITARQNFGR